MKNEKSLSTKSVGKTLSDVFWGFFLGVSIIAFGVVVVVPVVTGSHLNTVLTQSMQPLIDPGDVIFVLPVVPEELEINDIVQIQTESGIADTVTHRIIGITINGENRNDYLITTQGDNNNTPDEPVKMIQVRGKLMTYGSTNIPVKIPKVGYIRDYAKEAFIGIGVLAAIALISSFIPSRKKNEDADSVPDESETDNDSTTVDKGSENS